MVDLNKVSAISFKKDSIIFYFDFDWEVEIDVDPNDMMRVKKDLGDRV